MVGETKRKVKVEREGVRIKKGEEEEEGEKRNRKSTQLL
jgi:hypothetical protein